MSEGTRLKEGQNECKSQEKAGPRSGWGADFTAWHGRCGLELTGAGITYTASAEGWFFLHSFMRGEGAHEVPPLPDGVYRDEG